MNTNFFQEMDLKYPEIAICMEYTEGPTGKFFIPILTPTLDKSKPYIKRDQGLNLRNIQSDHSKYKIEACYTSNYLDLKLPLGLESANAGDKFVVIFVGGDINKPVIIGGYE